MANMNVHMRFNIQFFNKIFKKKLHVGRYVPTQLHIII